MTNSDGNYPDKLLYEVGNFDILEGSYEVVGEDLEAAKDFMSDIDGSISNTRDFSMKYTDYLKEQVDGVPRGKKRGKSLRTTAAFGAIFGRDPDNEKRLLESKFENTLEYIRESWEFNLDQEYLETDDDDIEVARIERIEEYDVTLGEMFKVLMEGFEAGNERAKRVY